MTKKLLRSIIEVDKELTPEHLIRNFQRLRRAVELDQLAWARPEDEKIYQYAAGFFGQFAEMPSLGSVLDYFTSTNGLEAIERLKDIQVETPYARANFANLLRGLQEQQISARAMTLLKSAAEITTKGNKEGVKGWDPAYELLIKEGAKLKIDDDQILVHQNVREAASVQALREEYMQAKIDKGAALGVLCGIPEIDDVARGIKKGDLWVHGAFPGELKTTFAENWAYNAMTRFNTNVVFLSLEMPLSQVRRKMAVLHTSNMRFQNRGFSPLDYAEVRYGLLSDENEGFWMEALQDFETNETYCTCEIVHPPDRWDINQVRAQLETLHKEFEVGMIVVDHGQWLKSQIKSPNYVDIANSLVDDCKHLATHFNANQGVPVLLLWQINREGKSDADKNDGVYKANAFTYANNIEKAADVLTTSYLTPEMKKQGRAKFSCLKNRDGNSFDPFEAHVNYACGRIMSPKRSPTPEGLSISSQNERELNEMTYGTVL